MDSRLIPEDEVKRMIAQQVQATWEAAATAAEAIKDKCEYCGAMSDEFRRRAQEGRG